MECNEIDSKSLLRFCLDSNPQRPTQETDTLAIQGWYLSYGFTFKKNPEISKVKFEKWEDSLLTIEHVVSDGPTGSIAYLVGCPQSCIAHNQCSCQLGQCHHLHTHSSQ